MELKDLFIVLKRRLIHLLVIFMMVMGLGVSYTVYQTRTRYVATARVLILSNRPSIPRAQLEAFEFQSSGVLTLPTRELILASPEMYPITAALYLAYKLHSRGEEWKWKDLRIASVRREKNSGLWVVEEMDGRIAGKFTGESVREVAAILEGAISAPAPVSQEPGTQIFRVQATDDTLVDAVDYANAYVTAATYYSREESRGELNRALELIKKAIKTNDGKLREARREVNLPLVDSQRRKERTVQASIGGLDVRVNELESDIRKNQNELKGLRQELHYAFGDLPYPRRFNPRIDQFSSPIIRALRSERINREITLALKAQSWTRDNIRFKELRLRINTLNEQERRELHHQATLRVGYLGQQNEDLRDEVQDIRLIQNQLSAEHNGLLIDLAVAQPKIEDVEEFRQLLNNQRRDRDRLESYIRQQQGFFRLETEATDGKAREVTPPMTQPLIVWALLAVILAVSFGYGAEYIDTRVHTDYDLRRYLNVPVLSIFERLPRGESPLLMDVTPRSPIAEGFHRAATILRSTMQGENAKVLMVASAVPREGKTTMAVNMAVSFGRKGLRTLLIDADLRIPQLHSIFGLDNTEGLGTLPRQSDEEIESLLKTRIKPSGVEGLDVMTGGPAAEEPMGLLESPMTTRAIEYARENYDVIILDTPPINSVGDALVLARMVDGVLMVVGAELADRRDITWAKHLLGTVNAKIYGATLNLARTLRGTQYYYYYYYHYGSKSVRSRE